MKILKIDHLGIAVKSIDAGKNFWTDALGLEFEGTETVVLVHPAQNKVLIDLGPPDETLEG